MFNKEADRTILYPPLDMLQQILLLSSVWLLPCWSKLIAM